MSEIKTRVATQEYREGWDSTFAGKREEKPKSCYECKHCVYYKTNNTHLCEPPTPPWGVMYDQTINSNRFSPDMANRCKLYTPK